MPGEFDFDSAVSEIGEGLGFSSDGLGGGADTLPASDDDIGGGVDTLPANDGAPSGDDTAGGAPAGQDTVAGAPPAVVSATPPPSAWRAEIAQKHWATLPPEVQQEVLKREQDILSGLDQYKENASFGKSFRQAIAPYAAVLQQSGIDPAQQAGKLLQAHVSLATGTQEQREAIFRAIAEDYQIDLAALASAADSQPFVDPTVQHLQKQVQSLQSHVTQAQQQAAQERQQTIQRQVSAFASDPKNIHFEAVHEDMAALIQSGVAKDLADAYEKAIWANPAVRAKELERQQAEKQEAERKAAAEKAEKARKATSTNVRTSARTGGLKAPTGTMEDTLQETLNSIRDRAAS